MARVRKAFDHPDLPRQRCGRVRRARAASGFTMLEILTVIGILAVLAAMVLLGMRHVTGKSKEQETRVTLQNLRSMLAEYENVTKLGKGPEQWPWNDGSRRTVMKGATLYTDAVTGQPVLADFWRVPFNSNIEATPPPGDKPAPLDAPGSFEAGNKLVRNGARHVVYTQLAMNFIFSVPANRSALAGLRADRLFTPEWVEGTVPAPGADRVLMTSGDGTETIGYYSGCRVVHDAGSGKQVYRYQGPPESTSPPPGGGWEVEGQEAAPRTKTSPTPILLDGWNNPILFVPSSGLRVRLLNGEKGNNETMPGQTVVIVSPEGSVTAPVMPGTPGKLVRPGRPFFVSAGPDGDFAKGDDNIYSFEE